jgi:hypothetical protein
VARRRAAKPGSALVDERRPRSGGELLVAQAVAVAVEREDFGVVPEAVEHRGGHHLVAEDLAQEENGLLEVTIKLARSYRALTSWRIRLAAAGSKGI